MTTRQYTTVTKSHNEINSQHMPTCSTSRLHLDSFPACVLSSQSLWDGTSNCPTHTDRSRRVGSGSNLFDSAASFGRASQRCHIGRPVHKNVQITSKNISIHFYHFFKNDNMYVHVDMLFDSSSSSSKLCIFEEVN